MSRIMTTAIPTANGATPAASRIQWGGMIKGAAIISLAVVAVGAVYLTLGAASSIILPEMTGTVGSLIQGAYSSAVTFAQTAQYYAGYAWGHLSHMFAGLPAALGYTTALTPATASSIGTAVQVAGTGAAAGIAAHATAPHLKNLLQNTPGTPTTPTPLDAASSGILASMKPTMASTTPLSAHAIHDISHASQHAAEHTSKHGKKLSPGEQPRGWRSMFMNRQAAAAQTLAPGEQPRGWSHKFTTSQNAASMASTHQPRDPNFASQLNADRTNLRDILGDGGRA
jgi:hypothetical protein